MIYTNELPEVVHGRNCNKNENSQEKPDETAHAGGGEASGAGGTTVQRGFREAVDPALNAQGTPRYNTGDSECGSLVCFADDGSESVSDLNLDELKISMEQQ